MITLFIPTRDINRTLGTGVYAGLKPTPDGIHVRYFGPFLSDPTVYDELLDDYAARGEKESASFDWYEITLKKVCFPYYLKDEPNLLVRVSEDGKTLDDVVIGIVTGVDGTIEHIDNAQGRFTAKIAPDMIEQVRTNPVILEVAVLHVGVAEVQTKPIPVDESQRDKADAEFLKKWNERNGLSEGKCSGMGLRALPGKPHEYSARSRPERSVMEEAAIDIDHADHETASRRTKAVFLPDWYLLIPREGMFPFYGKTTDGEIVRVGKDGKSLDEMARDLVDSVGGKLSMIYPVSTGFTAKIPKEKVDEVRHNAAIRYVLQCPAQVLKSEMKYAALQRKSTDVNEDSGNQSPEE